MAGPRQGSSKWRLGGLAGFAKRDLRSFWPRNDVTGKSGVMGQGWMRVFLGAIMIVSGAVANAAEQVAVGPASGLPMPRFVSLKADKVNVRSGPAKDHEVAWVYSRSALPVEVIAESDNWRRIRDWEGAEGWVYHSLLSGRRTALVSPQTKGKDALLALHNKPDGKSGVSAQLESGVLGTVKRCGSGWCRIAGDGFDGWIEQQRLWGVYPNEKLE
jgi:SH3-like domain-containing protein